MHNILDKLNIVKTSITKTVNNVASSGTVTNTVTVVSNAVSNTVDKISKNDIIKRNIIVENTIDAKYLTQKEINTISKLITFIDGETLEILYLFGGKFDPEISFENCELVGITNKRIFKYNNNMNKTVNISDIISITHKIKYPLLWNKLQFTMTNNTKEQIGIYGTSAPTFFIWYLTNKLPQIKTETHELDDSNQDNNTVISQTDKLSPMSQTEDLNHNNNNNNNDNDNIISETEILTKRENIDKDTESDEYQIITN